MGTKAFEEMYKGVPPWEIDGPQSEIVFLAEHAEIKPPVLDVGCGTGENALYLAGLGFEVMGIDIVPVAVEKALSKAKERSLAAGFLVWDALNLQGFDTNLGSRKCNAWLSSITLIN
jgi:SAM-dependent methyltransferase